MLKENQMEKENYIVEKDNNEQDTILISEYIKNSLKEHYFDNEFCDILTTVMSKIPASARIKKDSIIIDGLTPSIMRQLYGYRNNAFNTIVYVLTTMFALDCSNKDEAEASLQDWLKDYDIN